MKPEKSSKRQRRAILAQRFQKEAAISLLRFSILDMGDHYRVWQETDFGDVFDVVPKEGSSALVAWWKKHPELFKFTEIMW